MNVPKTVLLSTKNILFTLLIIILWTPIIEKVVGFVEDEPLHGFFNKTGNPTFSFSDWFNGTYQEKETAYKNENMGFRNFLVRFNHQVEFSFFNKLNANGVLIGKEYYLYEENYIKSYLGLDFVGEDVINENTRKLKLVQDTLSKLNVDLIFVIAPGKGSYFPEYFPPQYDTIKKRQTNYIGYVKSFKNQKVNYVDFNKWFLQMKKTSPYPLFPKGGIHWSRYGELLVCDSLIWFIEKEKHCMIPHLVIDEINVERQNKERDYDIGEGLNLIMQIETYPMAYPNFHFEQHATSKKLKSICIADSYYWGMFNLGFSNEVFKDGQFWYYNEQIYPEKNGLAQKVSDVDMQREIEKQDVVLVLCTEMNLYRFTFDFIDQLYAKYYQ